MAAGDIIYESAVRPWVIKGTALGTIAKGDIIEYAATGWQTNATANATLKTGVCLDDAVVTDIISVILEGVVEVAKDTSTAFETGVEVGVGGVATELDETTTGRIQGYVVADALAADATIQVKLT